MANPQFKGRYLQALSDGFSSGAVAANTFVGYDYNTCGAGLKALGVAEQGFNSGERVDVYDIGTAHVIVGTGGVTVGDEVMSDASGHAVTATLGNYVNGIALATVAATGIVEIIIKQGSKSPGTASLGVAAPGEATLSTGTKAVTISGLTTSSKFIIWRHTAGGTEGNLSYACTTNTLTITSDSSSDTSVIGYLQYA